MSRKKGHKLSGPFAPLQTHTTKSPAWKMLSVGARALFGELQGRYYTNIEGYVFISSRDGAKELRTRPNNIGRWLDELEHYGFIAKVRDAHLTGLGEGECAHYRLTDRYYHGQPPTRDFDKWSGEIFRPKKRVYSDAEKARLNGLKNNRPVTRPVTLRNMADNVRAESKRMENGNNCNTVDNVSEAPNCNTVDCISNITTGPESSWTTEPPWWTSEIIPGVAPHPIDIENREADSPLWVDAWLEQIQSPALLTLAEIRSAMGYRQ
jgi:hypothetical protein